MALHPSKLHTRSRLAKAVSMVVSQGKRQKLQVERAHFCRFGTVVFSDEGSSSSSNLRRFLVGLLAVAAVNGAGAMGKADENTMETNFRNIAPGGRVAWDHQVVSARGNVDSEASFWKNIPQPGRPNSARCHLYSVDTLA